MELLVMLLICVVLPVSCQDAVNSNGQEQLLKNLFEDYHNLVPPGNPIEIKFGFRLISFDFIDEANELVSVHGWWIQEWVDSRLAWDPKQYNISLLRIPSNLLWLPDIEVYNGISTTETLKANILLYSSGTIYHLPSVHQTFICRMNLMYFPYDQQQCSLKFGSWTYDGNALNLTLKRGGVDLADHNPSQDFILTDAIGKRNVVQYPCCEESYIDITYTMTLKRYSKAYTAKLVIPSVLAGFLILATFLLPPGAFEKITFCGIIFIILVLLLIYLQSLVPASGDTILGEYLAFAIFVNFFATIIAVVSYNINIRFAGSKHEAGMINAEGEDHVPRIPKGMISKWLQYFDVGSFVLFTFVFIIGLAAILGRRG